MTTEDDLLQLLADEIKAIPILQPNDVTIEALAKKTGRRKTMIESLLKSKVEAGELRVIKKYNPASFRNVNVYEKIPAD